MGLTQIDYEDVNWIRHSRDRNCYNQSQCVGIKEGTRHQSGYSTKDVHLGTVPCVFNHCMLILTPPNSKNMSVKMIGERESGFNTKHESGCVQFVVFKAF